ncbi:Periodic tryptophan protein 1 -like protein [Toxocara canis]|uniref:Periodic tryptophan protein 1-like protein n=1 Tax=Toxocara canis TaxID=6265 RepID=A0A0B2VZ44_TOXCA|nr:Periodic tryptophan protein 1 -like protein [Toxocara canis]
MDSVALISDLIWIKRGVAKHVPDKVKLGADELRNLIQGGEPETSEHSDTEEAMDEGATEQQQGGGLRGSAPEPEEEDTEGIGKYGLDKYDEEDKSGRNAMAGIATFTSPLEDPYITHHVDSDEEEDKEDFEIKPDDNLVAIAKINKGNLLGVGTMNSVVNIWDLDVVNAVEPVVVLGKRKTGNKHRRTKRDGSAQGHSDAVLCLSWNHVTEHVLASGSADETVVLWDLEEAKAATVLVAFGGKVQSLEWHPGEVSILLSGTLNGQVAIADCRQSEAEPSRKWKVDAEIEHVLWDHFNPFYFFVTTDNGKLIYMDSRADKAVFECDAHEGGARCVSQSFSVRGLVSTCGADNKLKVWKLRDNALEEIHSETLGLGGLHSLRFCPDSGTVLAVGGEKEDMVRIVAVDKFEPVTRAFSS